MVDTATTDGGERRKTTIQLGLGERSESVTGKIGRSLRGLFEEFWLISFSFTHHAEPDDSTRIIITCIAKSNMQPREESFSGAVGSEHELSSKRGTMSIDAIDQGFVTISFWRS
jgi:hypothetical protein